MYSRISSSAELSLLFQQQNPQSGERFAHGTEFKQCRRIRSSFLFPIRIPIIPEHRFFQGVTTTRDIPEFPILSSLFRLEGE